jgi:hypothetical protein
VSKDTFQNRTKERLALYKREVLNIHEDGIWRKNGRGYGHILPIDQYRLNVLSAFRAQFWSWFAGQGIRLHIDFHHLNSSQALCFNLFFPLLAPDRQGLLAIVKTLGLSGSPVAGASFEFEPDRTEGTNFDFMIPLDTGCRIYFEVKYTEAGFGSAKHDDKHIRKFRDVYSSRMAGRFEASFCTISGFLKNYQILRNLWHLNLASGDTAVFLLPRANQKLFREESIIRSCLLEPFRSRVSIVYIEDFISGLAADTNANSRVVGNALYEFQLKYFPSPTQRRQDGVLPHMKQ